MKRSLSSALLMFVAAALCLFAICAAADSEVRIVRLSDVQGSVQIDRATGQGFDKAFLNMPITQGVKLKTGDDGRAEVEFEDGTVIHVVPNTTLQFTDLGLRDSGGKVSTVDLEKGEAYFNYKGDAQDEFTVTFQHQKTDLTHSAHFRLNVDDTTASLAVFNGDVQVNGPSGEVNISKKHTATFDQSNNDEYTISKNIEEDSFDSWDKEQAEYHDRYQASNDYSTPYRYGSSDLNYYGAYTAVPGYGLCWQPYFAGMGWNPYMDGAWVYYPGFGYSWVSSYPWGWMPYHYGSWAFIPRYGWMWVPGNTFVGWNRVPRIINPPRNYIPPRPPASASPAVVAVGRGPMTSSLSPGARPGSRVALTGPTGGIGVPRGVKDLDRANRDFETHGQTRVVIPGGARGAAITAMPTGPSRMDGSATSGERVGGGRTDSGHMNRSDGRVGMPSGHAGMSSSPRSSPSRPPSNNPHK
jgi:FecR protein